ncbi:Snf7-domain-containing protein [Amylocarpus encephaloides]|uniref:Vacuolar-sorting protein SNF7 n=1 Tax=Amylocarpus encephaloides TaxID=45428 RepID=A0A9P7YRM6_9HELO|nr:Snf7-domain-containing protein [Amylocarpus encephaloides]
MSGVWGWFGGQGAKSKKDSPKNAILGLRSQLEMLQKRERHLQNQMDEQDAIARKNVATNKNAAKAALRRKKQHEHTLEQTTAQIATLEQQVYSIEAANINRETLMAMEKAGKAMADIHGNLNIDKVDDTMEKLREQHALGEEIANAITSTPMGEPIDEGELDDELEALEQERLDGEMLRSGSVPVSDQVHRMPAAANTEIKSKQPARTAEEEEEEELQKLQAEMAM